MKIIQTIFHMTSRNISNRCGCGTHPRIRSVFMRKDLLGIGLDMVLSGVPVFSSWAAGSTVTLHNHVPAVVARGQAKAHGQVAPDMTLNLSLGLPLRNREALSNLMAQIYDPTSANYGHYLTPEQLTEHFGPTEKDYRDVIEFARKNGLTVARTHANRMLLDRSEERRVGKEGRAQWV